jgi:hypothetical protein
LALSVNDESDAAQVLFAISSASRNSSRQGSPTKHNDQRSYPKRTLEQNDQPEEGGLQSALSLLQQSKRTNRPVVKYRIFTTKMANEVVAAAHASEEGLQHTNLSEAMIAHHLAADGPVRWGLAEEEAEEDEDEVDFANDSNEEEGEEDEDDIATQAERGPSRVTSGGTAIVTSIAASSAAALAIQNSEYRRKEVLRAASENGAPFHFDGPIKLIHTTTSTFGPSYSNVYLDGVPRFFTSLAGRSVKTADITDAMQYGSLLHGYMILLLKPKDSTIQRGKRTPGTQRAIHSGTSLAAAPAKESELTLVIEQVDDTDELKVTTTGTATELNRAAPRRATPRDQCKTPGCSKSGYTAGLCRKHMPPSLKNDAKTRLGKRGKAASGTAGDADSAATAAPPTKRARVAATSPRALSLPVSVTAAAAQAARAARIRSEIPGAPQPALSAALTAAMATSFVKGSKAGSAAIAAAATRAGAAAVNEYTNTAGAAAAAVIAKAVAMKEVKALKESLKQAREQLNARDQENLRLAQSLSAVTASHQTTATDLEVQTASHAATKTKLKALMTSSARSIDVYSARSAALKLEQKTVDQTAAIALAKMIGNHRQDMSDLEDVKIEAEYAKDKAEERASKLQASFEKLATEMAILRENFALTETECDRQRTELEFKSAAYRRLHNTEGR